MPLLAAELMAASRAVVFLGLTLTTLLPGCFLQARQAIRQPAPTTAPGRQAALQAPDATEEDTGAAQPLF